MYALWGRDLDASLRAPELRDALRAGGGTRLQVNVDDEQVAPAKLRITHFDTPVQAVASVWTEHDADGVSQLLSQVATGCVGWEVEEQVRLVPPQVGEGVRAGALAQIAFLRIPDGMEPAEWLHLWQGLHTPVAIETQATFGYIQNRVLRIVLGDERVDALVEELFPMEAMTDMHAFYGSGGDDAELQRRLGLMIESVSRFGADRNLDSVPTSRYLFDLTTEP
jgi:hypothetical protein